jgi:hypothetical protein
MKKVHGALPQPATVGNLREAIKDLPDDAPVLVQDALDALMIDAPPVVVDAITVGTCEYDDPQEQPVDPTDFDVTLLIGLRALWDEAEEAA